METDMKMFPTTTPPENRTTETPSQNGPRILKQKKKKQKKYTLSQKIKHKIIHKKKSRPSKISISKCETQCDKIQKKSPTYV